MNLFGLITERKQFDLELTQLQKVKQTCCVFLAKAFSFVAAELTHEEPNSAIEQSFSTDEIPVVLEIWTDLDLEISK